MKITDCLFNSGGCIAALGTFDGVHHGHVAVINAAKEYNLPVVVVTSKQNPKQVLSGKGGRILSASLCDSVFEQLGVSAVIRLDFAQIRDMQPNEYLDMLRDRLGAVGFVCGFNFKFGYKATGNVDVLSRYCNQNGLFFKACDSVDIDGAPVSSTRIRQAIAQGDMLTAKGLLGDFYRIDFEVSHGDARGRKLGFRTINQLYGEDFSLPRFGVYATVAVIDGKRYAAVTNVGTKPTFGINQVSAETHICGYNGDLYGLSPTVEFAQFIRDEIRFDSADKLIAQIEHDRITSQDIVKDLL